MTELRTRIDERESQLERDEAAGQESERQIEETARQVRELETQASATREQIAAKQATVENQQSRRMELEADVAGIRQQLATMMNQGGGADDRFRNAAEQLSSAEAELVAADALCKTHIELADVSQQELARNESQQEPLRNLREEHTRAISLFVDHISSLESQIPLAADELTRAQSRLVESAKLRDEVFRELERLKKAEADVAAQVDQHRSSLAATERRLIEVRREFGRSDAHHRRTEAHLTRINERIAVLTELEDRLEGLGTGVQNVLRMATDAPGELSGQVHGIVADLFHVDVDTASLVEVALGERTQFIVLSSSKTLLDWLATHQIRVADRVGFLTLDSRHAATALDNVDLANEPGVMGRADRFVETAAEFQALAGRLLGRTWLVDRLATALRLSQTTGRGLEFVTGDGEFLAADSTLIVGPRQAAAGMLSRRSELRSCHDQAGDLHQQLAEQTATHSRLEKERADQEALVTSLVSACTLAADKLADARRETASCSSGVDRKDAEHTRLEEDCRRIEVRLANSRSQIEQCLQEQAASRLAAAELDAQLKAGEQQLLLLQDRHARERATAVERQILLARCEQRVEMLRHQIHAAQQSQQEHDQLLADLKKQLEIRESQIGELDDTMQTTRQALVDLSHIKQRHTEQFALHEAANEDLRREAQIFSSTFAQSANILLRC